MKNILLLLVLLSVSSIQAQVVTIPDNNFKNALLNYNPPIDINNDNEIQVSEAENVTTLLSLSFKNISDLTGIEAFVNLTQIRMQSNPITSVDISANTLLTRFDAYNCPFSSLDVSNNTLLEILTFTNGTVENIDISNNTALTSFGCDNNNIASIDVSNQPLLASFGCSGNNLTTIDVSNNPELIGLGCDNNNISSLDVSNNPLLVDLSFGPNPISVIDLSTNDNIQQLYCSNTLISELDLSNMSNLNWIVSNNNPNLTYINLQNGNNDNYFVGEGPLVDLPNLQIVCVDDVNSTFTNTINQTGHAVTFTDDCPTEPSDTNIIAGNLFFDLDNDGCDNNDAPIGNTMVTSNNGSSNFKTFTQDDGSYLLYVDEGNFTTGVTSNLANYYDISPLSENSNFTGFGNTDAIDFCVTTTQSVSDLNIIMVPITAARPGFDSEHQIIYSNSGTNVLSGSIILEYDNTKLTFFSASEIGIAETANSYSFDYTNLLPFETRTIDLGSNIFAPPMVNIGDDLDFTVTIEPVAGDNTPEDNSFDLTQIVRGSFDPNDITVLEGDEILYEDIDKYLHYVIRFQNTGTDFAENIVVKNTLDSNLDWDSIDLQSMSHDGHVLINNDNEIDFIFEDINLPASSTNELLSNGFIVYRIKPKNDINIGDVMMNVADIYFDFNEPIQTNTVSTEVVEALSVEEFQTNQVSVYPNPTSDIIHIESQTEISSIQIFNSIGRLVLSISDKNEMDISNLSEGIYFLEIKDINERLVIKKILKN